MTNNSQKQQIYKSEYSTLPTSVILFFVEVWFLFINFII